MGLFDFITNIFSKSSPGKPKKKKKVVKKKAAGSKGKGAKPIKKGKKQDSSGVLPFKLDAKKAKKRKKTKTVSADPINADALGFNITLKGEDEQAKKRAAMRITVDGLEVYIQRLKKRFEVVDISATGLGFKFEKPRMKGGIKLKVDISIKGTTKVKDVVCKVMRHDRGSVGCLFVDLDRHQDDIIHEIVLLGQKEQTARRNAMKDRDFKLPS